MVKKSTKLIISLCILSAFFISLAFKDALLFSHSGIDAGQWWRLWTGHFTHVNYQHLLVNLLGLITYYLLYHNLLKISEMLWHTVYFATSIGLLLYFMENSLFYAGLSGVLYGKYTISALITSIRGNKLLGHLVFLLISLKIIGEQLLPAINQPLAQWVQAPIASQAHSYGYLSALFLFTIYWMIKYRDTPKIS